MVCVFTRTITDELAGLVSQLDAFCQSHSDKKVAVLVVLMTDQSDEEVETLERLASEQGLEDTVLTIYPKNSGPPQYRIARDYETTVLMWRDSMVHANHNFQDARLSRQSIDAVMRGVRDLVN